MRLPTKPWQTPTATGILPIFLASFMKVWTTSGAVLSARTTSSSFITLAGLKKWAPITCGARPVAAAISLTSR